MPESQPPYDIPPAVFLGYCLKEYWPTPDDWRECSWSAHVIEVCGASDCGYASARPPGWADRWDFNRASCWNEEASALACVSPDEQSRYRLYAYRAIPLVCGKSGPPDLLALEELYDYNTHLSQLPSEPDLSGFDFLGYDVVEYAGYLNYGCSPLSCNHMGERFRVNAYCLLDSLDTAYQAALFFGIEEPEPGPYIIFEIWRKR